MKHIFEAVFGFVAGLVAMEYSELAPWLARRLTSWSARVRYTNAERIAAREEELTALIDDLPRSIKLITAVSFAVTAAARRSRRRTSVSRFSLPTRVRAALLRLGATYGITALVFGTEVYVAAALDPAGDGNSLDALTFGIVFGMVVGISALIEWLIPRKIPPGLVGGSVPGVFGLVASWVAGDLYGIVMGVTVGFGFGLAYFFTRVGLVCRKLLGATAFALVNVCCMATFYVMVITDPDPSTVLKWIGFSILGMAGGSVPAAIAVLTTRKSPSPAEDAITTADILRS